MPEIRDGGPLRAPSCGCGAVWGGFLICHCPECHQSFGGLKHFETHRFRGKCREPRDIGLLPMPNKYGHTIWRKKDDRWQG